MHEKHELELYIASENAIRLHEERQNAQKREADEAKQRERNRRVASKEYKELFHKVKEYMELEKPYKRSTFSLSELASAVDSSPTMLSLMLNQRASTTFYDFVAHYRVEEFKRMATNEKFAHLTVTAISERCGFKKSTFFATFKRIEKCTPTEWLAKVNS
jgi:AraC-like DNA-binding protein